jgi:hypothetical protein
MSQDVGKFRCRIAQVPLYDILNMFVFLHLMTNLQLVLMRINMRPFAIIMITSLFPFYYL